MAHILSVSYDAMLLNTRQLLLESCGYSVTSAEGFIEALNCCKRANYDLLIIGHSIPHTDKRAIVQESRKYRTSPILALLRQNEPVLEDATESVDASRPELVLTCVNRLLAE
jgi:DNA-binding response OmpR family regulator